MKLINFNYMRDINYKNQIYFDYYNYNIDFSATKKYVNIFN